MLSGFLNFVALQAGWLSCVGGAAAGYFWLGPLVVTALLVAHLVMSDARRLDLQLILGLGLVGTVVDSLQAALGLLEFRGAPTAWLAPPWIVALWLHFATTRTSLLAWVRERPWIAAALGAVVGPLAYAAGVRLGAAEFHAQAYWSVLSIAAVWGSLLPATEWYLRHRS